MKTAPYIAGTTILVILAIAVGLAFNNERYHQTVQTGQSQQVTQATSTATTTTSTADNVGPTIMVETPQNGQTVAEGFELKGKARGIWYFEASFPAKIEDANGKILAQFPVTAQGDWMTTDFVPFDQTVTFATSTTPTGSLVLEKDNPSGLAQNAASITIPIVFATTTKVMATSTVTSKLKI